MRLCIGLAIVWSLFVISGCQPAVVDQAAGDVGDSSTVQPVSTVGAPKSGGGSVAIINLTELARLTGERERLQVAISKREADLNDRLALLSSGYGEEVEGLRSSFGDEPTEEEKAEISKKIGQFNASILEQRERARQEFAEFKVALEAEFLERVRPVALEVATELGYEVVLQDSKVLVYSESVDITVATVERLESSGQLAEAEEASSAKAVTGQQLNGGGQFQPLR